MFGTKRDARAAEQYEREKRQEAYHRREAEGAELYKRVAALRKLDRPQLPEATLLLLKDAQHQLGLIRQSIADRTEHEFSVGDMSSGDVATALAEDIADVMRENHTYPQSVFQALSEQFPKVHFTVDWQDATSMTAAQLRLERITGIYEGLMLAGLIADPRTSS